MQEKDERLQKIFDIISNDEIIYLSLRDQLEKDIALSGFTVTFENASPETLVIELQEIIQELLNTSPEKLRAFLYRVDIKEEYLVQWLESKINDESISQLICFEVLLKELSKVKGRKGYN